MELGYNTVSVSVMAEHTHTQMGCVSFFRSLCVAVPSVLCARPIPCFKLQLTEASPEVAARGVRAGAVRPGRARVPAPASPLTRAQAPEMGASRTALSLTRSGLADPQLVAACPPSPLHFLPPFPSLAAQGARCSRQHRRLPGALKRCGVYGLHENPVSNRICFFAK